MKTAKEIAEETFPKNIYISSYIRNVLEHKINQFKTEAKKEMLVLAKAMTEHLCQDARNEWFDIQLTKQ